MASGSVILVFHDKKYHGKIPVVSPPTETLNTSLLNYHDFPWCGIVVASVNGSTNLIPAYYSIYRPRKDERWVGLVGWPIADGLPTLVVTHQLQVERKTGKVRRPETDVLPLCHATMRWVAHDNTLYKSMVILLYFVNSRPRLERSSPHELPLSTAVLNLSLGSEQIIVRRLEVWLHFRPNVLMCC